MAKGDGFLYRYPDIFGATFKYGDVPVEVARRLHACREHSKATDRSLMELVEDSLCFYMTGDHLIKDAPCDEVVMDLNAMIRSGNLRAEVIQLLDQAGSDDPVTSVTVLKEGDCGGWGDERPFLVPPQGTCPNHYWSDEDLALSELIAEELPTLVAATLYNRYRFRRG